MKPIAKTLKLDKIEYYTIHLSLINCVLPVKLTPKEIEVLAWFISFDGDLALDRFGTTARKIVRNSLSINHQGLSNYMKSLVEKKFLLKDGDGYKILPILFPDKNEQTYVFKLINIE